MQRFLKSPTRLTAVPTGRFRHLTYGVRTTLDHRFKFAVNNVQQRNKAPTTMLAYSAAFKNVEARWFERLQEESTALVKILDEDKDRWAKLLAEEDASTLDHFEGIVNSFDKQRTMLLAYFDEWKQRHEKNSEKLVLENCDLLVRSSQHWLSTGFLISQQHAALGERSERMKLEKRYNVRGALGL